MVKCANVRRTHIRHRTRRQQMNHIQNNCLMCPPFSRTTVFSLPRQWSIAMSMICWSRFFQQVRTPTLRSSILEIECDTRSAAESPTGNWVQVLAVGAIQMIQWILTKHISSYMNSIVCVVMYAIGHIRPHSLFAGPSWSLTRRLPNLSLDDPTCLPAALLLARYTCVTYF